MTGRAERNQILALFLCVVKRADGGQFRGNLITSQRIDTAAALPLADLFQFKSQHLCRSSGIPIQVLSLVLQGAAGIITVFHSITSLSVRRKTRPPCHLNLPHAKTAVGLINYISN